ncbi:hypothetical protein N7462_001556 [Penicillium macrosclerotiorum]|uniref:uncharacterized protein n=1 Tax=Penicillium macrosclerotiorum TaxID=303699 RepID=UPI002549BAC0|nr:uncharacterized protein N7462_001556 [Penicillium macrosclerotiorum]KAJ5692133.1 hypothetical protein N7462_001556 [Penicillium macrosclerotiorum]
MAAPTQLAYRTLKGVGIMDAAPVYEPLSGFVRPEGNIRCSAYSPCGRYYAWASPEQVTIVDASVGHTVSTIPADNVFELGFSPLGTYVITWQRPSKDANGDAVKNLKVWRTVDTGDENSVVGHTPPDERLCGRVVTNEVQFYQSDNLQTVWNKLRVEGVADFALSPGQTHSLAVFVPERKGQPAQVKVFIVPQFGAPVSQKSFFKGDKVQLKWNSSGTTLIVLAQTEVDKTGKSYYGETTLYLLSASGAFDSRVDLDKEGPIHDVSWNPNSKEFGVVYGYMPAKTTIFNMRGVPKHTFPLSPRNTIIFSPTGVLNYHKITTVEASNASVCNWSPDGQYILTATTSPRLRVDNGVRIWHVGGGLMYNEEMTELYDVTWRPQSITQHPLGDPLAKLPVAHPSATAYLSTRKAPVKPAGAYRPPGGAAYVREGVPGAGVAGLNGFGKSRRRDIPGAEPVEEYLPPGAAPGGGVALPGADEKLSKSAAKNKKKREAAKKAREEGVPDNAPPPNAPTGPSPDRNRARGKNNGTPVNGAPKSAPAPVAAPAPAVDLNPTAQDKKIRGLLKKIRAIDELKMRLAGGEKLEDTQMKKIQTEDAVRKELEAVGFSG